MPTLPYAIACATCGSIFDAARMRAELKTVEEKLADPAVWGKPAESQVLMRERKRLEQQLAYDVELERRADAVLTRRTPKLTAPAVRPEHISELRALALA